MRSSLGVALVAAVLLGVAPVLRAYCSVELPASPPAPSQAANQASSALETDGGGHGDPCCDASPDAAVDDRASPKDGAPLVGKFPVAALALARGATAAVFAASRRRIWYDLPPPEPAFRRFPRLLR